MALLCYAVTFFHCCCFTILLRCRHTPCHILRHAYDTLRRYFDAFMPPSLLIFAAFAFCLRQVSESAEFACFILMLFCALPPCHAACYAAIRFDAMLFTPIRHADVASADAALFRLFSILRCRYFFAFHFLRLRRRFSLILLLLRCCRYATLLRYAMPCYAFFAFHALLLRLIAAGVDATPARC